MASLEHQVTPGTVTLAGQTNMGENWNNERLEHLDGIRFRAYVIESLGQLQEQMQQLTRLAKAYFRFAGPGRHRQDRVTRAEKMLAERKSWSKIYRACLPPRAAYNSRQAFNSAKRSLRNAVGNRQRRAGQSPNAEEPKPTSATNST